MHIHDFYFSGPPQPPGLTKRLDFENYQSKMNDIEKSKSKNKPTEQTKQHNISEQFMILSAYLCQNVSQSIANACSKFLFPVHFFGRNVTQFISNDGLKILGIIKTYKITSSFLKIDVFFLCTSTSYFEKKSISSFEDRLTPLHLLLWTVSTPMVATNP